MTLWFALLLALGTPQDATVTRVDLARSLLRFERAMMAAPPAGDKVADVNVRFDRATLAFFVGSLQQAVEQLDQLVATLGPEFGSRGARVAASVRWELVPPFAIAEEPTTLTLKCSPIYPLETIGETKLVAKLIDPAGTERKAYSVTIPKDRDVSTTIALPQKGLEAGTYSLGFWSDEGDTGVRLVLPALSSAPAKVAGEARERLSGIRKADPKLTEAFASCAARARVLAAPFGTEHEFCTDLPALMSSLPKEVSELAIGNNPYREAKGDNWRVRIIEGKEAPYRIYCPPGAVPEGGRPLVLAFHGAGGDEHMFFNAYGAGILKSLAAKHGAVVLCPRTTDYAGRPLEARKLVEQVCSEYRIDRSRIYLLGHSLGGALASQLALEMNDLFAAAVCFASAFGMPMGERTAAAPTLVIVGERDLVVPADRIRLQVEKLRAAKLPVEMISVRDYGHTLLVGSKLPFALEWLLSHRLRSK